MKRVVVKVDCVLTNNSGEHKIRPECLFVPEITWCLRAILTGNQTLHYTPNKSAMSKITIWTSTVVTTPQFHTEVQ